MREITKQYLRLGILILIVVVIIFYEPLKTGRMHLWSEPLESPIKFALDGVTYTFSEDLTVAEFEKNGWTVDCINDTEGKYVNLKEKLIPSGESMTLPYIHYTPVQGRVSSINRIILSIKNNTTKVLPYYQCECTSIYFDGFIGYDINVNFPQGITLGDSYGKVEEVYGIKGIQPAEELPSGRPLNPLYHAITLLYRFESPYCRIKFRFLRGKLNSVTLAKYSTKEDYERSQQFYEP